MLLEMPVQRVKISNSISENMFWRMSAVRCRRSLDLRDRDAWLTEDASDVSRLCFRASYRAEARCFSDCCSSIGAIVVIVGEDFEVMGLGIQNGFVKV